MRNLARDDLGTKLFYLVDIDTVPVANLRSDFTKFAKSRGLFNSDETMEAFITPAYEIKVTQNFDLETADYDFFRQKFLNWTYS